VQFELSGVHAASGIADIRVAVARHGSVGLLEELEDDGELLDELGLDDELLDEGLELELSLEVLLDELLDGELDELLDDELDELLLDDDELLDDELDELDDGSATHAR